jgi:hypothetical protein
VILLLLACGRVSYDVADLQLDVEAALPEQAELATMCVKDVGTRQEGAGNGRLAMTGLPAGQSATVTVTILDVDGTVLGSSVPQTLDADHPYETTTFDPAATTACDATGTLATDSEDSWLLAIRFTGSGW